MADLLDHAYTVARESIGEDTVLEYVQWLNPGPSNGQHQPNGVNGHEYAANAAGPSTMFGTALVNGQAGPMATEPEGWLAASQSGRYGVYSSRLQQDV